MAGSTATNHQNNESQNTGHLFEVHCQTPRLRSRLLRSTQKFGWQMKDKIQKTFEKHLSTHALHEPDHKVLVHNLGQKGKESNKWAISYRTTDQILPNKETYFHVNILNGIFYLLHINVIEQHRGQGHGAAFYQLLEQIAKDCECHEIRQTPSGWTWTNETRESYLLRRGWLVDGCEVYKKL